MLDCHTVRICGCRMKKGLVTYTMLCCTITVTESIWNLFFPSCMCFPPYQSKSIWVCILISSLCYFYAHIIRSNSKVDDHRGRCYMSCFPTSKGSPTMSMLFQAVCLVCQFPSTLLLVALSSSHAIGVDNGILC